MKPMTDTPETRTCVMCDRGEPIVRENIGINYHEQGRCGKTPLPFQTPREPQKDETLEKGWRHVAAYFLGDDFTDRATPEEARAEAVRRSVEPREPHAALIAEIDAEIVRAEGCANIGVSVSLLRRCLLALKGA